MASKRSPLPTQPAPSDSHPPVASTPSSRLELTESERAEGWTIEKVGRTTMKVLQTDELKRALSLA